MGECLDLVDGLPNGSAYVSAMWPERSWSEGRELATAIEQRFMDCFEASFGIEAEKRTHIPRPWDALLEKAREELAKAEAEQAERAREYIENQKWEAV